MVREPCETRYALVGGRDQEDAVAELPALARPVDTPDLEKRESVPHPDDLLP